MMFWDLPGNDINYNNMARFGFWISLAEQGVMLGLICSGEGDYIHCTQDNLNQYRVKSIYKAFKQRSALNCCLFYNPSSHSSIFFRCQTMACKKYMRIEKFSRWVLIPALQEALYKPRAEPLSKQYFTSQICSDWLKAAASLGWDSISGSWKPRVTLCFHW